MTNPANEALTTLENGGVIGSRTYYPTDLLYVCSSNNDFVFRIKVDGKVEVNPKFTTDQAVDAFWTYFMSATNLVQVAVEKAKHEEREAIVQEIEKFSSQWGILRSLKGTQYSNAAADIADLIRK